jgi:hypothetical protein
MRWKRSAVLLASLDVRAGRTPRHTERRLDVDRSRCRPRTTSARSATTVFYDTDDRLRAAVLLDAPSPATPAPLLPGMSPDPGQTIVETGRLASARRAGNGWAMVYGADASEREQLLRALRVQAP